METTLENLFNSKDSIYEGNDECFPKGFPYAPIDSRRLAIREAHNLEQKVLGITEPHKILVVIPEGRYYKQNLRYYGESEKDDSTYSPQIEREIESSKFILELPEDWDEEGSPNYSEGTWKTATQFIRKTAFQFKKETDRWIDAPKITPSHDGSIDVRWKSSERSLLINFPADSSSPATFFGSDKNIDAIKGTLNLSSQNHWLLKWLTR